MHTQGGLTGHGTDEHRHRHDQPAQVTFGPNMQPSTAMPPTVLVAMGDEPLLLQGWQDGLVACPDPADAVPLSWELKLPDEEGTAL